MGTWLSDTGKIIDYHHEGNINSIYIRCRSDGITLTDIPEVVRPQVRPAAAALGITVLFRLTGKWQVPGQDWTRAGV